MKNFEMYIDKIAKYYDSESYCCLIPEPCKVKCNGSSMSCNKCFIKWALEESSTKDDAIYINGG